MKLKATRQIRNTHYLVSVGTSITQGAEVRLQHTFTYIFQIAASRDTFKICLFISKRIILLYNIHMRDSFSLPITYSRDTHTYTIVMLDKTFIARSPLC